VVASVYHVPYASGNVGRSSPKGDPRTVCGADPIAAIERGRRGVVLPRRSPPHARAKRRPPIAVGCGDLGRPRRSASRKLIDAAVTSSLRPRYSQGGGQRAAGAHSRTGSVYIVSSPECTVRNRSEISDELFAGNRGHLTQFARQTSRFGNHGRRATHLPFNRAECISACSEYAWVEIS